MCGQDQDVSNPTQDKLAELEANILAQEHRLHRILINFLFRNSSYPDKNDPRRKAIISALWLNLLFSQKTLVAGGGIAALVTAVLMWQQNSLLERSLFPEPALYALVRPRVEAPKSEVTVVEPDIGIEDRRFEMGFASDGGPFLIDVVNLTVDYADAEGNVVRTDLFISKGKTVFKKLDKSDIAQLDVVFERLTKLDAMDTTFKLPLEMTCTFNITAIDSQARVWFGDIKAKVLLGDGVPSKSSFNLEVGEDRLRVKLQPANPEGKSPGLFARLKALIL